MPDITLQDEEGKDVKVGELAKDKGVVLFLYPRVSRTAGERWVWASEEGSVTGLAKNSTMDWMFWWRPRISRNAHETYLDLERDALLE